MARYLAIDYAAQVTRIPTLLQGNGSHTKITMSRPRPLKAFFPPLPERIEDERPGAERMAVRMPKLTMAEVERKVFKARAGKAAGEDGLPAIVRKETWPAVREHVLSIFQTSIDNPAPPTQWRTAKIIPLK